MDIADGASGIVLTCSDLVACCRDTTTGDGFREVDRPRFPDFREPTEDADPLRLRSICLSLVTVEPIESVLGMVIEGLAPASVTCTTSEDLTGPSGDCASGDDIAMLDLNGDISLLLLTMRGTSLSEGGEECTLLFLEGAPLDSLFRMKLGTRHDSASWLEAGAGATGALSGGTSGEASSIINETSFLGS